MKTCMKEDESYLKMLRTTNSNSYYTGYSSSNCLCVVCNLLFASPEDVMSHWEESPKCNAEKWFCGLCHEEGIKDSKDCKHFSGPPRVILLQSNEVSPSPMAPVTTHSNYPVITPRPVTFINNSPPKKESEDKMICPMPPPPIIDPMKPLPYRIDFLLNAGVIKHAKMSTGKNSHSPLYFEKKRPRKPRTHFTDTQVEDLEKVFEDKKYLSVSERQTIANDLNLHEEQVKNWFQNRRSKWRKDRKDTGDEYELDVSEEYRQSCKPSHVESNMPLTT